MTADVANAGNGENASAPAAAKAAPKDPWALPDVSHLVVGVLGGTGDQGRGLAYRLARAGQRVILGSRDVDRARRAAAELGHDVEGTDNAECARRSDIVIVAVPGDGRAEILRSLRADLGGRRLWRWPGAAPRAASRSLGRRRRSPAASRWCTAPGRGRRRTRRCRRRRSPPPARPAVCRSPGRRGG